MPHKSTFISSPNLPHTPSTGSAISPRLTPLRTVTYGSTSLRASATPRRARHAVVVGGGPAGLTSAILLQLRHLAESVTILEKDETTTTSLTREFCYALGMRVMPLLRQIPGLEDTLRESALLFHPPRGSIPFGSGIVAFPAKLGSVVQFRQDPTEPKGYSTLVLRRTTLLRLLRERLITLCPDVQFLRGALCTSVKVGEDEWPFEVSYQLADGSESVAKADLLIAADGLKSIVRSALASEEYDGLWSRKDAFHMKKWNSPSVGLAYKTTLIRNKLYIRKEEGADAESVPMESGLVYLVAGQSTDRERKRVFNFGSLPTENAEVMGRLGTVIRPADHALWGVKDPEEAYDLFEENFPQLDARRTIAYEDMCRFCEATAGVFPAVQRSIVLGENRGSGGAILLGDAAHAFPPDTGQGVNSALEDVAVFCDILDQTDCSQAAGAYSKARDKDITALIRMARISNPYQYGQNKVGQTLSNLNRLFRMRLSKLFPNVFTNQIGIEIFATSSYSEIERQVDATTRRIYGATIGLMVIVGVLIKAASEAF